MAIRCKASMWFEAKVSYEMMAEEGMMKTVKMEFVIDALTFGEAEKRVMEEASAYASGGVNVLTLKIATFKEICFSDSEEADKWYKVKINQVIFDEKSEKEKHTMINILVQASSLKNAQQNTEEYMHGSLADYTIASVTETNIYDVLEYTTIEDEKPMAD
ncbi:MAG: DUF4494 domain-containing protein [Prevotella sp.]|nr:DUF4494 domain-containing protein [Candidatus Equicola faecalis]